MNKRLTEATTMVLKFIPNSGSQVAGKLADAELRFDGGPLDGLKLIGFAVMVRKGGRREVVFPSRTYTFNGERRDYALLRPTHEGLAQTGLRDLILEAFAEYEAARS